MSVRSFCRRFSAGSCALLSDFLKTRQKDVQQYCVAGFIMHFSVEAIRQFSLVEVSAASGALVTGIKSRAVSPADILINVCWPGEIICRLAKRYSQR